MPATTAELLTMLARQAGDRAAILAELRGRGIWAETTALTDDERAGLLADEEVITERAYACTSLTGPASIT
jgi:2-hydroxychromene-2-carboxylate isomerase